MATSHSPASTPVSAAPGAAPLVRGYLCGHFDLIQIGDIDLVHAAKRHCDHLTVGVTTDELHVATTGGRPVVGHGDRREIVAHLRAVDVAVADAGQDIVATWRRLRFEVLFLGPQTESDGSSAELQAQLAPHGVTIVALAPGRETDSELIRAARRRLEPGRAA
jgi:glycerol-3-phosphate cytidylyltransferase